MDGLNFKNVTEWNLSRALDWLRRAKVGWGGLQGIQANAAQMFEDMSKIKFTDLKQRWTPDKNKGSLWKNV